MHMRVPRWKQREIRVCLDSETSVCDEQEEKDFTSVTMKSLRGPAIERIRMKNQRIRAEGGQVGR